MFVESPSAVCENRYGMGVGGGVCGFICVSGVAMGGSWILLRYGAGWKHGRLWSWQVLVLAGG